MCVCVLFVYFLWVGPNFPILAINMAGISVICMDCSFSVVLNENALLLLLPVACYLFIASYLDHVIVYHSYCRPLSFTISNNNGHNSSHSHSNQMTKHIYSHKIAFYKQHDHKIQRPHTHTHTYTLKSLLTHTKTNRFPVYFPNNTKHEITREKKSLTIHIIEISVR